MMLAFGWAGGPLYLMPHSLSNVRTTPVSLSPWNPEDRTMPGKHSEYSASEEGKECVAHGFLEASTLCSFKKGWSPPL